MLSHVRQCRSLRSPVKFLTLSPLTSFIFSEPSASAAKFAVDDEPTTIDSLSNPVDIVCEIITGVKTFGPVKFLEGQWFRTLVQSLNQPQVDQIVDVLRIESPDSAVLFFDRLKSEYGFRHSRVSHLLIAHVLAGRRRCKELRSALEQMLQQEAVVGLPLVPTYLGLPEDERNNIM